MKRIVVAGALAARPGNAGGALVRQSWVRGLARLGFEVLFVEQAADAPDGNALLASHHREGEAWFRRVTDTFGPSCSSVLLAGRGDDRIGRQPDDRSVAEFAESAEMLVNLGGHLQDPDLLSVFRRRAYVDLDPGFTQVWWEQGATGLGLDRHDLHFTVGVNVGTSRCTIPTGGFEWRPVRPPVVLSDTSVATSASDEFTTVGAWRGPFGPLHFGGRSYGIKVHEFRRFLDLPGRTGARFRAALQIYPGDSADRQRLLDAGWELLDPATHVGTLDDYRSFIARSGAEFSAAQGVYVHSRSGWFSDRSAQYLAAGKPVLVQSTGFDDHLPTGLGLVGFESVGGAADGVKSILGDYQEHCARARRIAEEYFDSDRVLRAFLNTSGVNAPVPTVDPGTSQATRGPRMPA